jgi:hypothetical protein
MHLLSMKRFFLFSILLLANLAALSAQVEKPYFQVFDISDETKNIKIEAADSFSIRKWNGVQLMVDMSITLEGGNMDLLSMIIFDNRYAYEPNNQGDNLLLRAKLKNRSQSKLKYLGKPIEEKIVMTIYIPDGFEMRSPTEFVRKEDAVIASDKR